MALDEVYQKLILDHFKNPRNFGKLPGDAISVRHVNPNCGDRIDLYISLTPTHTIQEIKFDGYGCAVSQASASMMTKAVEGKPASEARALRESFDRMLAGRLEPAKSLGDLTAFTALREFPARIQCAKLAWTALIQGLDRLPKC